jgi:protein involved in polysaccharide export with SLBB domain
MKVKRFVGVFGLLIAAGLPVVDSQNQTDAQGSDRTTAGPVAPREPTTGTGGDSRVSRARSADDYPVTPGDVYQLTLRRGVEPELVEVTVAADYSVNLGAIGSINAEGLTFPELEDRVEDLASEAYPASFPRLRIQQVASFEILATGELSEPGVFSVDGPVRLDQMMRRYFTDYSAVRSIQLIRRSGMERTLDLYAAREEGELSQNPYLQPGDRIQVSRLEELPVVFFEGAVQAQIRDEQLEAGGSIANQLRYEFLPGETLREAARTISPAFLATAELSQAFLVRAGSGERLPVDLNRILYSEDAPREIPLERNDRIVVPFRQYFVTVSGAVANPGQYPYIPDRGYEYYLGLAGGTAPQRHIGENPRITSIEGERKPDDAVIEPEDNIFFASTNPIYHLSPILGVASTVLSTIALYLSVQGSF